MKKTFFLITTVLIILSMGAAVFLTFLQETPVMVEEFVDTTNATLVIEPKMSVALTQAEKDNLSAEWNDVRQLFLSVKNVAYKINGTASLDSITGLKNARLVELINGAGRTVDEIRNELKYPAESVDEKIASVVGTAVVIVKLSVKMKALLDAQNLGRVGKELQFNSNAFQSRINVFKMQFFNAIKIPDEEISDDLRNAFTPPINESDAPRFSQYDGRRFFERIKQTTVQLEKDYQIN